MKFFQRSCLFMPLIMIAGSSSAQLSTVYYKQCSKNVNDSFEIYITRSNFRADEKVYNVVYYCDANLKSGKALRQLLHDSTFSNTIRNTLFVGIGHIGNFHVLRRRDFILPTIKNGDTIGSSKKYGQIENFYLFLKDELIPQINNDFKTHPDSNAILGHSLGGLFAFYCLFKNENVFAKYFALSPALWIDKYAIYHFNKTGAGFGNKKLLYFSAGSEETMNKILKGTDGMKAFLDQQQYGNLQYIYEVQPDKTHNSQVPLSLYHILNKYL